MTSLAGMDQIFERSMIMRKAHELDVSMSEKNSHIFCSACSKGNMKGGMTTTTYFLICGEKHGLGNVIHHFLCIWVGV